MKKIDMHCHVLPRLDDGSSGKEESLEMLKIAAAQGVKAVIATPHYSHNFCNETPDGIRAVCRKLEKTAQKEISPDFKIHPGQEILFSEDTINHLKNGKALTMADSRYILVEFMPSVSYSTLFRAARELVMAQYLPIFAHIERYGALTEHNRVEELIESGVYMQMNYRHIGGKWYSKTTSWCRKMLKEENIHFLGTDMHNTKTRGPETKDAFAWMQKHLDEMYLRKICYKNAEKVLDNIEI